MAITTKPHEASVGSAGAGKPVASAVIGADGAGQAARLTSEQVWRALARTSFAVVSYVTPDGAPRSSGVLYTVVGRRLYVATAPDSWKARHIAISGEVAVTVPVHRGGVLSLLLPIPPATVSFHGTAIVHPADSAESHSQALAGLDRLLPAERRASRTVIEIVPKDRFLTFGVGVPLMQMASPAALAHVPVS